MSDRARAGDVRGAVATEGVEASQATTASPPGFTR